MVLTCLGVGCCTLAGSATVGLGGSAGIITSCGIRGATGGWAGGGTGDNELSMFTATTVRSKCDVDT